MLNMTAAAIASPPLQPLDLDPTVRACCSFSPDNLPPPSSYALNRGLSLAPDIRQPPRRLARLAGAMGLAALVGIAAAGCASPEQTAYDALPAGPCAANADPSSATAVDKSDARACLNSFKGTSALVVFPGTVTNKQAQQIANYATTVLDHATDSLVRPKFAIINANSATVTAAKQAVAQSCRDTRVPTMSSVLATINTPQLQNKKKYNYIAAITPVEPCGPEWGVADSNKSLRSRHIDLFFSPAHKDKDGTIINKIGEVLAHEALHNMGVKGHNGFMSCPRKNQTYTVTSDCLFDEYSSAGGNVMDSVIVAMAHDTPTQVVEAPQIAAITRMAVRAGIMKAPNAAASGNTTVTRKSVGQYLDYKLDGPVTLSDEGNSNSVTFTSLAIVPTRQAGRFYYSAFLANENGGIAQIGQLGRTPLSSVIHVSSKTYRIVNKGSSISVTVADS